MLAFARDQFAQLTDFRRSRALRGQGDQRGFGQAPGAEDLPRLLRVGGCQACGVARALDDYLLVAQAAQYPSNHGAADAKCLTQRLLRQGAARRQALFKNGIEQAWVDLLGRQAHFAMGKQWRQGGHRGLGAGVHQCSPEFKWPDVRPGCSVRYPCAGLPGGCGGAFAHWPGRCSCCGWRGLPLRSLPDAPPGVRGSCAVPRRFA
ncbi:hypothetical protein D3C80_1320440 [compost metagenome]